jgi:large subunit ribosomal protein L22|uniref:Large ribosomal subunit protein uL22 n=1 Tax=candidate division WOR-3 bacterium TaxID=2052148 RepID=A0A7C4YGN2_UNCW3
MEGKAIEKYIRVSPKKARRIVKLVQGKSVKEALAVLDFTKAKIAHHLWKAIHSASMNLINNSPDTKIKEEDLYVKSVRIENGPFYKRLKEASQGRGVIIRRRTSHIIAIVEDRR